MSQYTLKEHTVPYVEHSASKSFKTRVQELLPDGGNLTLCLSCGACSSSCPANGLDDMDPRKFLRLASIGMDDEIKNTPWVWKCSLCMRCVHNCPMQINIPQLVYYARQAWPEDKKPKGITTSCQLALKNPTNSAMGAKEEDFEFVVQDVLGEIKENQPDQENLTVPIDKENCNYVLNQNSREPVTEPEELGPLWKILQMVEADWTYPSAGWAAENYCLFAADDEAWKTIVQNKVDAVHKIKGKTWLNTE